VRRVDADESGAVVLVGELTNEGASTVQVLGMAVLSIDADGRTVATASAYVAEFVIAPGHTTAFRAELETAPTMEPGRIPTVISVQPMAEVDAERVVAASVPASEVERVRSDAGVASVRATITNPALDGVTVFPTALGYDASGELLAVGPGPTGGYQLAPGEQLPLEIMLDDLPRLGLADAASDIRIRYLTIEDPER
jgi:hypothetical protein